MDSRLSAYGKKKLEKEIKLKTRALQIFSIVVNEWESDPMSVQCFDLRIVNEARKIEKELRDGTL